MVTYSSATENKNSAGKPNHKNGSTCNTAIEGPSHGHRQYTVHRKLGDVWMYDSETCEQTNKQTGRKKQTDTLITILRSRTGDGVKTKNRIKITSVFCCRRTRATRWRLLTNILLYRKKGTRNGYYRKLIGSFLWSTKWYHCQ